ncbi:MAG: hypothetical protein KKB85_03175, partial [Candidatus Altiarchaeota archaeon]|nr:hypothetical protein [Candidatus Altiarchaeota archaeon]
SNRAFRSHYLAALIVPVVFLCFSAYLVDPGFRGTLTMGLKNLSGHEFRFQRNARVAQIVFEEVSGETKEYDGHYQGGKVV